MSATRPLRIAIVGTGRIAEMHARAVVAEPEFGELVAVADVDLARAAEFAQRHGVAKSYGDFDSVLADADVDGLILCTPNWLHVEQTLAALAAGKHVLLEKPFAETIEGAERLVAAAAERSDLALVAGHTFRHVPAVRYLVENRGKFGKLRAVDVSMCVHWDGPQAPWWAERTAKDGVILSLYAPHAIDFVQLAVGPVDPLRVFVESARYQSGWKGEDEAMILLKYETGTLASIHVSYNQPHMTDLKLLHFEKALVKIENGDTLYVDGEMVVPPMSEGDVNRLGGRDGSHYFRCQFREFVLAARGEPNFSVLPDEALRITKINDAVIAQSAEKFVA